MAISEELKLVITAEADKAVANLKQFQRTAQSSKGAAGGLGASLKKMALQFGAAYLSIQTVKKALQALTGNVEAYFVQERAEAKLTATLKATGNAAGYTVDQLKEMASEMQNTTRFGDELVISAQSVLSTFRNISGDVFPETISLAADMAETMGVDLQSATVQLAKALNDPATGLTYLNRSGVTFSETQKTLIKQYAESNDLLSAQKVILAEVENQFGGVARMVGDTAFGAWEKLKNAIGDVREELGENFIKSVRPTIEWLTNAVQWLTPLTRNIPEVFKIVAESILDILREAFTWDNIKNLFVGLGRALYGTFLAAVEHFPKMFLARLKYLFNPLKEIGEFLISVFNHAWAVVYNKGVEKLGGIFEFFGFEMQQKMVPEIENFGETWDSIINGQIDAAKTFATEFAGFLEQTINALAVEGAAYGANFSSIIDDMQAKLNALRADLASPMASQFSAEATVGIGISGDAEAQIGRVQGRIEHIMADFTQEQGAEASEFWQWYAANIDKTASALENVKELSVDVTDELVSGFSNAMSAIGAAFVEGEEGIAKFGQAMLGMVASVLEAMGREMLIDSIKDAVIMTLNPAAGIAGAAIAFAAAGAVRAMASNMAAKDAGGMITEPVFGVGQRSGRAYAFAENRPETVGHGGGGGVTIIVQGNVVTEEEMYRRASEWQDKAYRRY